MSKSIDFENDALNLPGLISRPESCSHVTCNCPLVNFFGVVKQTVTRKLVPLMRGSTNSGVMFSNLMELNSRQAIPGKIFPFDPSVMSVFECEGARTARARQPSIQIRFR